MAKNPRGTGPEPRPITKIELTTGNEKLRWIGVVLLFVLGIGLVTFSLFSMLNVEPGWEQIEIDTKEASLGADLKLMYDLGPAGGNATAVKKTLIQVWSAGVVDAYRLFSSQVRAEGLQNMAWLNDHVNQPVAVAPELYQALAQVAASGSRQLFLAPVQAEYTRIFLCTDEAEAMRYDPARDPELAQWLAELTAFTADPAHIRLEMLEGSQVQLTVSREYAAFAQDNGITVFADFGWMRNAFAADLLAQRLLDQGFRNGYLVSFDGFTRNLDDRGQSYSLNLFDRQGTELFMAGTMEYSSPMSIVFLRDYPMGEQDKWSYYSFSDGRILTPYLDSRDGMSKSALHNLVAYSGEKGCGAVVLAVADTFIAAQDPAAELMALKAEGIFSIWPQGTELYCNGTAVNLTPSENSGGQSFVMVE